VYLSVSVYVCVCEIASYYLCVSESSLRTLLCVCGVCMNVSVCGVFAFVRLLIRIFIIYSILIYIYIFLIWLRIFHPCPWICPVCVCVEHQKSSSTCMPISYICYFLKPKMHFLFPFLNNFLCFFFIFTRLWACLHVCVSCFGFFSLF